MVLEKINQVATIKKIPPEEYDTLAEGNPSRSFLITKISQTGGHLASNLGVVGAYHGAFIFVLIFRRIR